MYKRFIITTSLFSLIFILSVNAQLNIGVSPPVLDLGNINPDSSKIARFNLISTSSEVILTYMTPTDGRLDWFKTSDYKNYASNFSEQSISSWVEFIKNPVEVEQTEGGTIKGASEVVFILKVPKDLEPGYHMGIIKLDPMGPEKRAMFNIKAVVPLIFIFRVPGNAIRNARIIDVVPGDYSGDNLNLNIFVQSTGTVTLQSIKGIIDIFDKNGKKIITLKTGGNSIKPGEVSNFNLLWPVRDVEEGVYDTTITFDYSTGLVSKNTTIKVTKISIPTPQVVKEVYVFPWWVLLAIIIIFVIAYLIYKR